MNDYSKWDKIVDSEDDAEEKEKEGADARARWNEQQEQMRSTQDELDTWLRRQINRLDEEKKQKPPQPWEQYGGPPELVEDKHIQYRKVTKEERKVLAMLVAISHFEEGTTNLDRHPQMLDIVRHHRWLEEDPGTLELLCRLHNLTMQKAGEGQAKDAMDPNEIKMRQMCFSGINTLAAAKVAGMSGGLLEMVTAICTPTTDTAREWRKKWQKKEFAKDAVFESLFPDLKAYKDTMDDRGMWKELMLCFGFLLLLAIVVFLIAYSPTMSETGVLPATTTTTTTLLAAPAHAVEEAAKASVEAAQGSGGRTDL